MSDKVGLVTVLPPDGVDPLLMDGGASERTRQQVDMEGRKARRPMPPTGAQHPRRASRPVQSRLDALLERETLDRTRPGSLYKQTTHRTRSTGH